MIRIDVHIHPADESALTSMLKDLAAKFQRIEHNMSALSDKVDSLVTHVGDLKTAVASGMTQITTVASNVASSLDGLAAIIADLKAQLATQGVDQATMDKLTAAEASVDQIKTDLSTGLGSATTVLTDAVGRDTPA